MKKTDVFFSKSIMALAKLQQPDGSFVSFSSSQKNNFEKTTSYHTTFANSLILLVLTQLPPNNLLQKKQKKLASYLLAQKNDHWSWNYWAKNSIESKTLVYPDDLDDTFCALSALFSFDPSLINGSVMAHVVSVLAATEKKEGGPYCTWLVSDAATKKWRDVDIAVNSNVAYFLSLLDIRLPNLDKYLSLCIKEDTLSSPYYPSEMPIIYFLSRFYKGKYKKKLIKKLISLKKYNGSFGNSLETALAISALLHFDFPASQLGNSVNFLRLQEKNGLWDPYAFCIDPAKEGKTYYAGSQALTTVFCLEAISLYERKLIIKNVDHSQNIYQERLIDEMKNQVIDIFKNFDARTKDRALCMIDDMLSRDKDHQISLLPYYFSQAFQKSAVDQFLLRQLGVANILGWLAYTIYDDFLDEEGDVVMLSIAHTAFRYMVHIFETIIPEKSDFNTYFHQLMNKLDSANAWEMSYAHLKVKNGSIDLRNFSIPRYTNMSAIAEKSLGHALGPIAIMFALGFTNDSQEVKNLYLFFTYFIIAKQLNDDARDWEEDLKKGHITPVVSLLLIFAKKKKILSEEESVLKVIMPKLQQLFWEEVIQIICNDILDNIKKAKEILQTCAFLENQEALGNLLARSQQGAEKALEEKKNMSEFIKNVDF